MIFIRKGEKNQSGGSRDREDSNSLKWKGQAFFLSQKMSGMADCCSSEDKNKNPFRVTSEPRELPQDKRASKTPVAGPNIFLKARPAIKRVVQCIGFRVPQGESLQNEMLDLR